MNTTDKIDFISPISHQLQTKIQLISTKTLEKVEDLVKILSAPIININKLRSLCFYGIPDEINGLKSLCWKVLLGYLPKNRSEWQAVLDEDRKNYEYYIDIFLRNTKIPPHDIIKEHESSLLSQAISKKNVVSKFNTNKESGARLPEKNNNFNSTEARAQAIKTEGSSVQMNTNENDKLQINEKKINSLIAGSDVDHPLSTSKTSEWNTYFKDIILWDEIEKDTKRFQGIAFALPS